MSKYNTSINKAAKERIERNRAKRDENRKNRKSVFEIRTIQLQNKETMRHFVGGLR